MKQIKRILVICLAVCMLLTSFAFAATPSASLISPVENSIVADDQLLISIKVLDKTKIRVNFYEEKLASLDKDGKPVLDKDKKEVLISFDVKDLKKEDFEDIQKLYEKETFKEVKIGDSSLYTGVGEAGYFTKTIEKLDPGLYRISIEVIGKDDKVTESYSSFVALQEKPVDETATKAAVEADSVKVETQKVSLVQTLVNFIKSIIK